MTATTEAPAAGTGTPLGLAPRGPSRTRARATVAVRLVLSLVVVLGAWWLASRLYGLPFLFPGPTDVADRLVGRLADGSLLAAALASLGRILAGFSAGCLVGVVLGVVIASNPVAAGLTAPFVTFFRFVPPLAWFALVLVWFGSGDTSKIVLIMYTSIFVVALNTIAGVSAIPHNTRRMAAATEVSWWQRPYLILLPGAAPYVFAGMRIAIGNAFMTIVGAEMLGASEGLGVILNNGMTTTNVADVFVCIVALGVLGLVVDRLFVLLINTFGRRYQGANSAGVA